MRLLLDTHILLWALAEPKKIPKQTRAQIEAADKLGAV
jgi:PIN domain nuclease of toxin-antitoxin system